MNKFSGVQESPYSNKDVSVTCSFPCEGIWSFHLILVRDQGHQHSQHATLWGRQFHSAGSSTIQNALGSSWVHLCDRKYPFSQCTNTQTLVCVIFLCWPTFNNFSLSFFSYCCKKMLWRKKATKEGRVYFSTEFKMQSFMTEKSRQWGHEETDLTVSTHCI